MLSDNPLTAIEPKAFRIPLSGLSLYVLLHLFLEHKYSTLQITRTLETKSISPGFYPC